MLGRMRDVCVSHNLKSRLFERQRDSCLSSTPVNNPRLQELPILIFCEKLFSPQHFYKIFIRRDYQLAYENSCLVGK